MLKLAATRLLVGSNAVHLQYLYCKFNTIKFIKFV